MKRLSVILLGVIVLGTTSAFAQSDSLESSGPRGVVGGDVTFCELFDLRQFGRVGDVVGLSVATTSWNVGGADLMWFATPDEEHPFIAMNLYRLKDGRFEQIGQSWVKHGFFALDDTDCGGNCTYEPGHAAGDWLGVGCTDTYGSGLNANQSFLGPRYEINPWTGVWSYAGSHFTQPDSHTVISHRLQVHDDDLDPALNQGASYYAEAYYVMLDDVNVLNSAAWKPVTPAGNPGGTWTFQMTDRSQQPNIGFAIDAWSGASQTFIAQEIPPVEFQSPDGRCLLAGKAADLGEGFWRYEYALLNIDMDRQVGGFQVSIAPGATVRNVGFHAVRHHDEPINAPGGAAIDNAAWVSSVGGETIEWTTDANPLRWGTLYNYWFEVNLPPITDAEITLTHFKPGDPASLTAAALGPSPIAPDCDGNRLPDPEEIADDPGLDCNDDLILDSCQLTPTSDADNDGILNECDSCAGHHDLADRDGDGLADGCDPCPDDNPDDSDGDGVCDGDDLCPGFDDAADADGDGAPDGCDTCPDDNPDDSDGDGVCDSDDACPGINDAVALVDGCEPAPEPPPGACDATNPLEAVLHAIFGCCAPQTATPLGLVAAGLFCMKTSHRRRSRR